MPITNKYHENITERLPRYRRAYAIQHPGHPRLRGNGGEPLVNVVVETRLHPHEEPPVGLEVEEGSDPIAI